MKTQLKVVHSLQKAAAEKQSSIFTQILTGLLSVIKYAVRKPRLNRMTKPNFTDKEIYWKEEIRQKLQKEKNAAEEKKLAKQSAAGADQKKKSVHRFNNNFNQKRKAQ